MATHLLQIAGLQSVLEQLYTQMLPMCSQLISVGQAFAGLGALIYIGMRVARHLAAAEPVDVPPLLRPFAIGLVIALYPNFIGLLNGVLSPTVDGTSGMVTNANAAIVTLLQQKEDALKSTVPWQLYNSNDGAGNESLWELYSGNVPVDGITQLTSAFGFQLSKSFFNLKNSIKIWLSEILQILYEAAALCVNTIRTFQLIILALTGPLTLGLSVFDPFRGSLNAWLARYVRVFLWLPVANILGALLATIQAQMIQLDIQQIQASGGTYFSSTDIGYLIFLLLGVVSYFTVPSIAGYIVQAGQSEALLSRVNKGASMVAAGTIGAARTVAGAAFGIGGTKK